MASRGPGDGYAGGCRRVQGPSEFLSVGTCAVLAPCLREARSCLVAAWCRGGCCPRGPAPGDLVLLLLATRAPYSPAVFLAAHHPSGECGPSPSWTPRWVGSRRAEFSLGPIMDFDFAKRTSASAAPGPSASAVPNPPASAAPPASANPQPPNPPQPLHHPLSSVNRPTLDVRRETTGTGRGLPPSRPRVLVFTSEQCRLTSLSPFQRREGCDRFGKIKRCEKLRDGGIEVEFVDEKEAGKALSATHFSFTVKTETGRQETKVPITVTAHRTKNSSQGVVYCTDLEGVSNDEIADGLSECGVSSARRIMTKRRGTWVPTHSVVLSFNQEELPRDVTIGYVRVKVRPYIPNPMRCYRCQRFGHTRIACRNRPACAKCASTEHLDDECEAETFRCANCPEGQNAHTSYDKACPTLAKEKEINSIKVTRKVSFREARELYSATHPSVSYAQKTKVPDVRRASVEEMSAAQLLVILRSFGLAVVAPGAVTAAITVPPAVPGAQTAAEEPSGPVRTDAGPSDDEGWTRVQHRGRGGGRRPSPPTNGSARSPPPTAVMEAQRRGEPPQAAKSRPTGATPPPRPPPTPPRPGGLAVKGVVRRLEGTPNTRPSPRPDTASVQSATREPASSDASPGGNPPPLGPPPPPPPQRQRERPTKRTLPVESSPAEGGSPRARQRFLPGSTGRSSSVDGRRRGHTPIQFGDGSRAGAADYF